MFILSVILTALFAYLVIGGTVARIARPTILAKNTTPKGDLVYRTYQGYNFVGDWVPSPGGINRRHARLQFWRMIFGWPGYLPVFMINHAFDQAMDRVDPLVHAKQAARIAELEKELQI